MKYRQFADHAKQAQRLRHRAMTEPGDEWWPEVYFDLPTGVERNPIPPPMLRDADTKWALWNQVVIPYARMKRATKVALAITMFILPAEHPMARVIQQRLEDDPDESPTQGLPRFQDVEGTIEVVAVSVIDAERHEMWHAPITRGESGPPHLAPFYMPTGPDMVTGDMVDPIKAALR